MPTPIEAEDAEIFAPVLPPDAAEIQPRGADPMREYSNSGIPAAPAPARQENPTQEYLPDVPDPVRQLGASALSVASLEAAGAPTPRGGLPMVGSERDGVPWFGEEEPFVPRFEPFGGVVPAPVPTVSFTSPKPTQRPLSPLSDLAIPESDEPAYVPKEEFLETELPAPGVDHNEPDTIKAEAANPPARPWSAVDPAEVEFVGGEQISVEVGAFGSESHEPVESPSEGPSRDPFAPTSPSWEGILAGETPISQAPEPEHKVISNEPGVAAVDTPASALAGTAPAAPPITPVTPVASFFAATAARNTRRTDGLEGAAPTTPFENPVAAESLATEIPITEWLRAEPVHTAATAYTPSTGAWPPPAVAPPVLPAPAVAAPAFAPPVLPTSAFAPSDAVTQVDGMARIDETTELPALGLRATDSAALAETGAGVISTGENGAAVKTRKTHRRRRLVLWIVLGAVIAAGAGTLVYRMYFLPEPVTLPVPTATAQAPTATAEPMKITDSSDFVAAMPTTVGTNVLVDYKVTDTVGDTTLPARAAEHVRLAYGPGSSSKIFTVEAYQHYNVADATTAYDSYAMGATDVKNVTVNGAHAGMRAFSTVGSTGTVVWRNGTAVFDLTGPSDDVIAFYEHFGI